MLFVTGINDLLPPGIRGIMLTGLLGALASTLDTHLNWGSSYWSNDIYSDLICKKWRKKEAKSSELVWVARFSNILILLIALTIMFNLGSIQEAWTISLLFGAGMGSVLVLRWLWEQINLFSEIAAIVTSLILAPILLIYIQQDWLQLFLMATSSTFVAILVTYFTPATSDEILDNFYNRIKPQGFWKKSARRNGDSEQEPFRKLGLSLVQTTITAISLFCLLVGFGKLMFRPSSEGIILVILLLAVGFALIPVWWKSVLNSE
jgi:Na+/proline symporter